MAAEPFNIVGGLTVGIPPNQVIDSNGNIVSNFLNLSGNVSAANVYATNYRYSNGQPLTSVPGGSNTQLQYNNEGLFGGISTATYDGSILNLGDISTLNIGGGLNGYILKTDGNGTLSWTVSATEPGGSNTQVQFNDSGTFNGVSSFTYNKNSNTLTTGNISLSGNITATYYFGDGQYLSNLTAESAKYVTESTQSNITELGNLIYLNVDGDIISTGNISVANGEFTDTVTVGSNLTINSSGVLNLVGNLNSSTSSNVYLGSISNVHISGGNNYEVLSTDGSGNLSWVEQRSPGGSNTQVQYNNNGEFGGSSGFTFDDTTNTLEVTGNVIANTLQVGSGAYRWSTIQVYSAVTNNQSPNQLLYSIPISEISGVDFEIIATDDTDQSRQFCRINSLYYEGTVQYNEYASLYINGGVGSFDVDYNPGDIFNPPKLELKVTPSSANFTTYKMLITVYAP